MSTTCGKMSRRYICQQFYRTKMCDEFMEQGSCQRGRKCHFAHKEEQLRIRPTLDKTKMCSISNCSQFGCNYAHSREELSGTNAFLRTKMCRFLNNCTATECRFAHSQDELMKKKKTRRAQPLLSAPASSHASFNTLSPMQERLAGLLLEPSVFSSNANEDYQTWSNRIDEYYQTLTSFECEPRFDSSASTSTCSTERT
eukprot:GEMP01002857.1.p1 GENE.GEMP01002857.1~~GEMP01002857.1.p1  ORF type:complete len:199 (+),score=29.11 GEMP01002857.1:49-645(+)